MNTPEEINSLTRDAYNLAAHKYHELFRDEMNEKDYDRKLLNSFAERFDTDSLICDAGCGPSAHIGRYLFDKGIKVTGVDISEKCVELASIYNPDMKFECADITNMPFEDNTFDGVISYYSIINTPKINVNILFNEFYRVLKHKGCLLVAVKAGTEEGFITELLGIRARHYFSLFTMEEITDYYKKAKFTLEFIEKRNPYDFEIYNQRIFAIGKKQ